MTTTGEQRQALSLALFAVDSHAVHDTLCRR
ncbi:hypothetical protein F4553_001357 [Allocatelliglobosispora scoriae]|uniref:Uncharacterized protein n=1 Tax=Allocatelliglobosispora scoriae TaxID=643052 RepID=A0A841BKU0_9ACTN|nr:hypothetical protein [Allocatelliglobosispora scoriae]